ncbi:hypothetical protein KCM76_11565 [Zooshikella marina]|uniref:hypothetical protein n=1 Tax=Zooshikella ganghwensis TaxID=202772 RepID=UPI001BB0A358|nr:hypothetical protein [Zooshikella ganghwensis]MBU2706621.1 hypothetical protein [Zooshikella ganghwensis]
MLCTFLPLLDQKKDDKPRIDILNNKAATTWFDGDKLNEPPTVPASINSKKESTEIMPIILHNIVAANAILL